MQCIRDTKARNKKRDTMHKICKSKRQGKKNNT